LRAQELDFGEEINLSKTGNQVKPDEITLSGSNVYVVYTEIVPFYMDYGLGGHIANVFFKASNDTGDTWQERITLSDTIRDAYNPHIAASEVGVNVVWVNLIGELFFRASNDNGATFGDTIVLHSDSVMAVRDSGIAASGNNVYVVYNTGGSAGDVFFTRSINNGVSFEPPIQMGNIWGEASFPRVVVSDSNVYVVWSERTTPENLDVYFRASNDYGATFGPIINLSGNAGHSYDQRIAVSGNNVYVIWKDATPGHFDVFLRASNDNGATFGPTINLSNTSQSVEYPQLAVSGNNVYVVWDDNVSHVVNGVPFIRFDVFFSVSNDNGATFSTPMNLSDNLGTSQEPQIATAGSSVYVLWRDSGFTDTPGGVPVGAGILLRVSENDGATFGTALPVSENPFAMWFKIAATGNYIHVVRDIEIEVVEDGRPQIKEYVLYSRSPPGYTDDSPIPPDPIPPFANTPEPSTPSPTTLEVTVDVKPYSSLNTVNCNTLKGGVPVGILSEDGFDAQDIDVSTLELEGISAQKYVLKDLDGDGDLDGVARFKKADLCESGEILSSGLSIRITLTGLTDDDTRFEGNDSIRFRR
jgi:hypothetical protein